MQREIIRCVVSLGKALCTNFPHFPQVGGNGYSAIGSGGSCQYVSV